MEVTELRTAYDRSTLQRAATCPRQNAYVESGQFTTVGEIAESANCVHDAISATAQAYVDNRGLSPQEIVDDLQKNIRASRPDVQPDACAAIGSLWSFARYLSDLNWANILRFDGGYGEHSGQLSADVFGETVTGEVDFLHSTESPEVLQCIDWKAGWKPWTESDVPREFQFQVYSFLILENYPKVEAVRFSVWMLRLGRRTYSTLFHRGHLEQIRDRIGEAISAYQRFAGKPPEECEAWPARERCAICPAAAICDATDRDIRLLASDPGEFLRQTVQLQNRVKARQDLLSRLVDATGRDIVTSDGDGFGVQKPQTRKPRKSFYQVDSEGDDTDAD